MKHLDTIALSLAAIALVLAVVAWYMSFYLCKKYERKRVRNEEVYNFRKWVLNTYPHLYDQLPDYYTMFKDNKPLTLDTYLPDLMNLPS